MSHLSALLNTMESIEIDRELGLQIFENYVTEYVQLIHEEKDTISEKDFEVMKEVAVSLGLDPKDFESAMNTMAEDDEYDKYDAQVDNVVDNDDLPPGVTEFTSYLNRWVSPNPLDTHTLY